MIDEGVTGNPEELKPEELHEQAWKIVKLYFEQAQQKAIDRYQQLANTEQAINKITEVVLAAYYQRVDSLFVAVGLQQWASFAPDTGKFDLHREQETGDEDLMDFAAIHTLLNSGTVYAVEPEKVPGDASLAAIFRY